MQRFSLRRHWYWILLAAAAVAGLLIGAFFLGGTEEGLPAQSPQTEASEAVAASSEPPVPSKALESSAELPAESDPTEGVTAAAHESVPATEGTAPTTERIETPSQGTEPPTEQTGSTTQTTEPPTESEEATCTISISCETALRHPDQLREGLLELLPTDGVLLHPVTMTFTEGESVFDILRRATVQYGIQMEFSKAPLYGSAYIEGIGNLYERDCGSGSGWMYSVNGSFPNLGCSACTVEDGDVIRWQYTCELGADIGGGFG